MNDPLVRSMFKWETPSRLDLQLEAERDDAANQRLVYALVSARESCRCRVCDRYCDPHASSMLRKGHHHHIVYLSACGPTTVQNVCLLCAECHNDETQHRIRIEGNANEAPWLTIWKPDRLGLVGPTDDWYVWKQEVGIREYEHD